MPTTIEPSRRQREGLISGGSTENNDQDLPAIGSRCQLANLVANLMNKRVRFSCLACWIAAALPGCAATPSQELGNGPYTFHDTRLQYALLTDDRPTLKSAFSMTTEPTVPERIAAGFVLPVSAAAEAAFWPLSAAFHAYHESF